MLVVACVEHNRSLKMLNKHYPTLGDQGRAKSTLVLFSPNPDTTLPEGGTRWQITLPVFVSEHFVRLYIQAREGVTKIGDRYATIACSPEGDLAAGERIGEGYLFFAEGVSIRAYQRHRSIQFTIKEYLIREYTEKFLDIEVNITRGNFDGVRGKHPQYAAALKLAIRRLERFKVKNGFNPIMAARFSKRR